MTWSSVRKMRKPRPLAFRPLSISRSPPLARPPAGRVDRTGRDLDTARNTAAEGGAGYRRARRDELRVPQRRVRGRRGGEGLAGIDVARHLIDVRLVARHPARGRAGGGGARPTRPSRGDEALGLRPDRPRERGEGVRGGGRVEGGRPYSPPNL